MKGAIHIEEAGLLTTVQDLGRAGYQRFGMPVGGAMDTLSAQLANLIIGNGQNDSCLEATLIGPKISFLDKTAFCVCGADIQPRLNNTAIENNKPYTAKPGDSLSFAGRLSGCRAYIAFAGGIDVPVVMGSRSTLLSARLGGFEGRPLQAGDHLNLFPAKKNRPLESIPEALFPQTFTGKSVRILPGPEAWHFSTDVMKTFLSTTYTISSQSNRMGYRLEGPTLTALDSKSDIISSAIPFGTIQLPSGGQPIILMADRQTTGGYPRLAVVASVDLPYVAQLMPGDDISFTEISLAQAQELIVEQRRLLNLLST